MDDFDQDALDAAPSPAPRANPVARLAPTDPYFHPGHPQHAQRRQAIERAYAESAAPAAPSAPARPTSLTPAASGDARAAAAAEYKATLADKTHAYWSESVPGHRAAVEKMAELKAIAEGAEPPPLLNPTYTVAIPPGRTSEDFTPIQQSIVSAGTKAFGLTESGANAWTAWTFDATQPKPARPRSPTIPSEAAAETSLRHHWGDQYERQMGLAEATLFWADRTRGGAEGELLQEYVDTGAARVPGVIQALAEYSAVLANDKDPARRDAFRQWAAHFEADHRARARGKRRPAR